MNTAVCLDVPTQHLLRALAEDTSMSLARLCKRLGLGASVVMRQLSMLGDQPIGGLAGPGWVSMQLDDGRWTVALTALGRDRLNAQDTELQHLPAALPEQGHHAGGC